VDGDIERVLARVLRMLGGGGRAARRTSAPHRAEAAAYPGDYMGPLPRITYSPNADGRPDPGEVVWAPVPYQEDSSRSKDRPVLLIGRADPWLLALPLTSQDHDRDAAQEASEGRYWIDVGSGAWDHRGRASEAALHRILRLDPHTIRREGAVLDREVFEQVRAALEQHYGPG